MTTIDDTLAERGARYGDFTRHAKAAQRIQRAMRKSSPTGWAALSDVQRQALTVIADKLARILTGDPNYADNWHDIQGYAKLVEERLPREPALLGKSFDTVITDGLDDGWIEWRGGERPVPSGTRVEVRGRDGAFDTTYARHVLWGERVNDADTVVAYRSVKDAPKPDSDADGWIEWHGGDCPVPPETRVEVRFRDYDAAPIKQARADHWDRCWDHSTPTKFDIVAYRIAQD